MPSAIIKPSLEEDFYVEWSYVCDAPSVWGDRATLTRELMAYDPRASASVRFERADATGTSFIDDALGDTIIVQDWDHGKGYGTLKRTDIRTYCERMERKESPDDLVDYSDEDDES